MAQIGGARAGAGRKRGALSKAKLEVREACLEHAPVAIRTLVRICKTGDTDSARVSAAKELLDRAYGKAIQAHRVGGLNGGPLSVISGQVSEADAYAIYQATLHSTES